LELHRQLTHSRNSNTAATLTSAGETLPLDKTSGASDARRTAMPSELTEEQVAEIRKNFRRCRDGTIEEIIRLRETGDTSLVSAIVRGIVWRYLSEEARPTLDSASPEQPLASFGVDSLMMLEIVLDIQDALNLTIEDQELRQLQTIGDLVGFLEGKYAEAHKPA
jgi:acyl carrier protein